MKRTTKTQAVDSARKMLQFTIIRQCQCGVAQMLPERMSFDNHFTHQCLACLDGITAQQNDDYNKYWGYSGYDEVDDQE